MHCVMLADVRNSTTIVQAWVTTAEPNCTGYILTGAEMNAFTVNSVFTLSLADGGIVAGAIASVWIAAFAFRAVRSVLKD